MHSNVKPDKTERARKREFFKREGGREREGERDLAATDKIPREIEEEGYKICFADRPSFI